MTGKATDNKMKKREERERVGEGARSGSKLCCGHPAAVSQMTGVGG
jgi:hypothetical protein